MQQQVTVYSSDLCGFCQRAKALLHSKGIVFDEIKIDGQPILRLEMIELTGGRTVPQIIIGGQTIGGCDDLYALERSQRLDTLLDV